MEVKVSVDGVQRVVCGVTEETTCEEVVIALAQALSQPGCYTLREKFKEFERSMTPAEHLLESLRKYGEQAREVQLTLLHSGPSPRDGMSRTKVGRYPPCPPVRRREPGVKTRQSSGSLILHRQSLPPLSCSQQEAQQQPEDQKKSKRKSLSFVEEARGWLESLGKSKVYNAVCDKESSKKAKRIQTSVEISVGRVKSGRSSLLSKVRSQKSSKSDMDQTSCCMGTQVREKEHKYLKKSHEVKPDGLSRSECAVIKDEKNGLRETIKLQRAHLQDLQFQVRHLDKQIIELEEQQRAKKDEQEAQKKMIEEELEQIGFWENELKAEEGYEKELQRQFLEMKTKVVECKAKLEVYKCNTHGFNFLGVQNFAQNESEGSSKSGENAATETPAEDQQQRSAEPNPETAADRKFLHPPHALVPPHQIKERRPTGPTELREWWARWSETQNTKSEETKKVVHRSELTIYLGSAKV